MASQRWEIGAPGRGSCSRSKERSTRVTRIPKERKREDRISKAGNFPNPGIQVEALAACTSPHQGQGGVLVTIVIQANTGFCLSNNSPWLPHCYRVDQGIGTTLCYCSPDVVYLVVANTLDALRVRLELCIVKPTFNSF